MHLKQIVVQSIYGLRSVMILSGKNPLTIVISVSKPCFYIFLVK